MTRTTALALALLLPATAHAAPSPGGAAAIVGGATLGGAVVGGLGLGAVGAASLRCPPEAFGCFAPFVGAVAGGTIGALGGAVAGAGISAHQVGARPLRTLGFALAPLGVGFGAAVAGAATGQDWLVGPSLALGAAGFPLGAVLAAGTDRGVRALPISVLPEVRADVRGVRLSASF